MTLHSSKTLLPDLLEAEVDATLFVPGPTYDRDVDLSLAEFARRSETVDVLITSPNGRARDALQEGHISLLPSRVADYPLAMKRLAAEADRVVGDVEVAPPSDGQFRPGIVGQGVDTIVELADVLVAEVNELEPRLPGLAYDIERFDYRREVSCPLPTIPRAEADSKAKAIGKHIAELIPDRAILQFGIGQIPAAIVSELSGQTGFGLHSGFLGPFIRDLVEDEIVTRGSPILEPGGSAPLLGAALAIAVVGPDREFYRWLEGSGAVQICGIESIATPEVRKGDRFVAINSAIEVDILGQVNATHIASQIFSGPGGQPDYFRRARQSEGGIGIIALKSATNSGISKIVDGIPSGGAVTTQWFEPDYVVTEQGVADIRIATPEQRAKRLIQTAHPDFREELRESAQDQSLL
jgi:acyl-CoA hydrolase